MKTLAFIAFGAILGGCANPGQYTYTVDIQPILAAHCETCHAGGEIAPFPLQTYQDAFTHRAAIASAVQSGLMPPWPPDDTCNSYKGDPSLSAQEIATLVAWADYPSEGNPTTPTRAFEPQGISQVGLALPMPAAYTPQAFPDDYRCFLLDWPETETEYVTGLSINPGNPKIVHNAMVYIATPDQLSTYEAQEQVLPDGGVVPNYSCFGGPVAGLTGLIGWLGFWEPGVSYSALPADTGVAIAPGSKLVLQVHYSSANAPGESDLSTVQLALASSVAKQGALLPFSDPFWVLGAGSDAGGMEIPAGQSNVQYQYQLDPGPLLGTLTNGAIPSGTAFTVYSAAPHMLQRGTQMELDALPVDGGTTCLVRTPVWQFGWQSDYFFQNPVTVNPGDQLSISCTWDNSAANQPFVDGGQVAPVDMNWGVGPNDEMCLGMLYVTL